MNTAVRCTKIGAVDNGLRTTIKYLRGAANIGLGTTVKYLRRTTSQRPEHHDQVTATRSERRRGQQLKPIPGITDALLHHKCPAFAFFYYYSCLRR
jgi:hypothetical protein